MKTLRYIIRLPVLLAFSPIVYLVILVMWAFSEEAGREMAKEYTKAMKP